MKLIYHDPCYLGRYSRLDDAPREILAAVPGLKLVEMERNRMDAWCCGDGGVKLGKHDYAVAVGRERVEEAIAITADVLVAACPVCIENFNEAEEAGKFKVTVLDIAELLCKSLA